MKEILEKLATFDTPSICNIIELFDVRSYDEGYMDQTIRAEYPDFPPMVGFAVTTTFRAAGRDEPAGYQSMAKQLEMFASLPGPAVVVFQDLDHPTVAATFGEVMCSTYQGYGSTGLVTSGAGRDIQQVRALGYPVFTSGTNCSHAYHHILDVGTPVHVGGIMVRQGDLLHGDANGVTSIPVDIAAEIADIGDEFIAAEDIMLSYVKGNEEKTVEGFIKRRKEMNAVLTGLRTRVTRKK